MRPTGRQLRPAQAARLVRPMQVEAAHVRVCLRTAARTCAASCSILQLLRRVEACVVTMTVATTSADLGSFNPNLLLCHWGRVGWGEG